MDSVMNENLPGYENDLIQIEAIVKMLNLEYRTYQVRSLKCIQIKHNEDWVLFDPINRRKDFAFAFYLLYRKHGGLLSESDFRRHLLNKAELK